MRRPYCIWKLDAFHNKISALYLGSALYNRGVLQLSDRQIDILLASAIAYENQKNAFSQEYPTLYFNNNIMQINALQATLTSEQYNQVFMLKNLPMSIYKADQDWEALKKSGLINNETNKEKTMKENQEYELRAMVAAERWNYDKTQRNLFLKREAEDKKPVLLKKLFDLNDVASVNKRTKDALAW